MNDFQKVVMGDMPIGIFAGIFFIALMSAIGVVLYRAVNKAPEAVCTPDTFQKKFFLRDNFVKWVLQILTIGFMIRLTSIALTDEGMFAAAFAIGFGSGQFSIWAQSTQNKAREQSNPKE